MKPEVMKGLLGLVIGAGVGLTIIKMAKSGNLDIVIDEEAVRNLLPKKEKVINPNGEDFTVVPKTEAGLIEQEKS